MTEETKKSETKKEEKPSFDISSVADTLKAIDEKYNKSIAKRNEELVVKNTIADKAGTKSRTKIAGLRGLSPRWGEGIKKS